MVPVRRMLTTATPDSLFCLVQPWRKRDEGFPGRGLKVIQPSLKHFAISESGAGRPRLAEPQGRR